MTPLDKFVSILAKDIQENPDNWHSHRHHPACIENRLLGVCIKCIWRDTTSHNGRYHIELYLGEVQNENLTPLQYEQRSELWEAAIVRREALDKVQSDKIYKEANERTALWMKARGIP